MILLQYQGLRSKKLWCLILLPGPSMYEDLFGEILWHILIYIYIAFLFFLPRILCSTPLSVMAYILIWYVPPFEQGKVFWYLVVYCLFQSMQTVSMSCWCLPVLLLFAVCISLTAGTLWWLCSASMCRIPPSPCSSAVTRRRGTLPLLIVCRRCSMIEWLTFGVPLFAPVESPSLCCSQAWWWRCWAQFWAPQSRDRL